MLPFIKKKTNSENESEMSFLDHIDALRKHLFRAAVYIVIIMIVVFLHKKFVFDQIILSPLHEEFVTYQFFCNLSPITCFKPGKLEVFTRELSEQLTIHLKVSFFLSIVLAFPLLFRELWLFIKPGLYQKEQKVTRGVVLVCSLLFYTGVAFGYFVIAPFSISFLASYTVSESIQNTTTLSSYVDSLAMFSLLTGIVFEMPLAIFFLAKLGIISATFMRTYRRYAIVIISIVAAVITPPDLTSMFMVTLPLLLLYELSIYVAARAYPKENPVIND